MQLPQDTNYYNCAVCFINSDTGFIAGDSAGTGMLIQRTLDGGQTWTNTNISNGGIVMSICFPDDSTGYAIGRNGVVYKTFNMGNIWTYTSAVAFQDDISTIYFTARDTGFAADFDGKIFKTVDGGSNWNIVSNLQSSFTNFYPGTGKFQFINDTIGFLADGNYGSVRKTIDGGNNWTAINLGNTGAWALSIYMFNKDTGIVIAQAGKIWRTVNGGTNWFPTWINTNDDLLDILFFNDSVGYIVGGENNNFIFHSPPYPPVGAIIYVSYDAGTTWHLDTTMSSDWLTSICDAGNNIAYAVGWHGWAYKLHNANLNVAVSELKSESLISIYPNPTSENIFIETELSDFEVEILDVYGHLIYEGANEKRIKMGHFDDGIYFLRVYSEEGIVSKKIILQK